MSGIECSLEDCTPFRDEKALKCHQGILKRFTVTIQMKAFSFSSCSSRLTYLFRAKETLNHTLQPRIWSNVNVKSLTLSVRSQLHMSELLPWHWHLTLFALWPLWPSVVQDAQTYCRRRPCDCGDPDEDLFCCPGCDNRPNSQCLDQSGRTLYRSGASWLYGCQQCRCMVSRQKHVHLHVLTYVLPTAMKADLHLESLSVVKQVTSQNTQNVLINLKLGAVFFFNTCPWSVAQLCVDAQINPTSVISHVATNQHVSCSCSHQISWFTHKKAAHTRLHLCWLNSIFHRSLCLQEGEVDCWPLVCPVLMCEYTAVAEGECCPRCVTDPCLADNLSYDIRQTCQDPAGIVRLSGDTWHMPNSPCTTCQCKVGQSSNTTMLYCAASRFD